MIKQEEKEAKKKRVGMIKQEEKKIKKSVDPYIPIVILQRVVNSLDEIVTERGGTVDRSSLSTSSLR